ncbi:hypothetical protein OAI69_00780 [bacterium]|nr:hypothetical protein [bacterium]
MKIFITIFFSTLFCFNLAYGKTIVVKANPEKGFHFPYLLKTSKKTVDANYIVVESNNTGGHNKSIKSMTSKAKKSLGWVLGSSISKKLNYPMLMPVFPYATKEIEKVLTNKNKYKYYFPQLDSDVLKIDIDKYKRIDLQLIAMIDDARGRLLKENNQNINEKVIMVGFSSSSLFSARFTFLHPERVSVAIGGGIGGLLPVPAEKINGIEAIYPIGTYDFENITGTKFNLEEYKKTPQFYYQGTKDKSNPFRRGADDLTDEEYEIVKKLFVNGLPFEDKPVSLKVNTKMWENSQKYINQIVDNVKFESPKNLDHEITPAMTSKSIKFIKENLN